MAEAPIGFQHYWVVQFEVAHTEVLNAINGMTDEGLYFQPTPDANSVAWLAWHLYRWQDTYSAMPSGEPDEWVSGGWTERFGIAPERGGVGDTPEQVAAFRPSRDLLMGYVEAAHRTVLERVKRFSNEQLSKETEYAVGEPLLPYWAGMLRMFNDTIQHTGQITYLRGITSGIGWKQPIDWSQFPIES